MLSSMASRPLGRIAIGAFILLWIFFAFAFLGGQKEWYADSVDKLKSWTSNYDDALNATAIENEEEPAEKVPISYNLEVAPKVGCESVVQDLQLRLIREYQKLLKGVRYANIWGYLETENKGDAAIWAAQQILLSTMGIQFEQACRFMDKGCDLERFNGSLRFHKPYSAIIMAGGGNFNDFYWEDQPSRIKMIENYHDIPIRAFPQSIHMTHSERIKSTQEGFGGHPNLQVAARDQPSYDWLTQKLSQQALGEGKQEVKSVLVPDIAFMWGNRPDFRTETKKTHDILILARDDSEISAGADAKNIPFGTGTLDLGGRIGNVTYQKVDWKFTHTPGIDTELPHFLQGKLQGGEENWKEDGQKKHHHAGEREDKHKKRGFTMPDIPEFVEHQEVGRNQRAWAKAIAGFELLGSAKFVITDRLHGHIMSTIIGVPHVLMDSKLGKNLNFHDTWTQDCECTRVTTDFEKSLEVARLYFESLDDGLQ